MSITRRQFVSSVAGAAASTALPRHLLARRQARVLVVGAGAAGLAAAFELQRAGHEVRVLEASQRAGGRIYTMRQPFSDGLYAEVGAQGFVSHNIGLEYARELGLEVAPVAFASGASLFVIRGRRLTIRPGEGPEWPVALRADEVGLSHFELASKYFRGPVNALPEVASLKTGAPLGADVLRLDEHSVAKLLDEGNASEGARELLGIGYYHAYLNPTPVSLLQLALERGSFQGVTGYFRVVGGNDLICTELARRLGGAVTYGRAVRAVRQTADGVTLGIDGPSGPETVQGDFAVVTPPPPVLRDVLFEPALSTRVMQSFSALRAVSGTRIFVEANSRFWESEGLSGSATTDGPLGLISHSTAALPGPRAIVDSYTYGEPARAIAALPEPERLRRLRSQLDLLYPEGADLSERGASHAWGEDPWVRCNFVTFQPGQVAEFLPPMRQPQGRVYLAGDTVGGVSGYSHAAFWSGRSVAEQIIARA